MGNNEGVEALRVDVLGIMQPRPGERVLILDPGEGRVARDNELVARTQCRISFRHEENLQACIRALRESDEELKKRPDSMKSWEWDRSFREGMDIEFGVLWYDERFFETRKDVWKDGKHAGFYARFGASPSDFTVKHEVLK
jgi:hypothetical protein